jgi:Glutathione-dependent formaldehyde-activating enzyme
MKISFTGGCSCGAVRYECTAEPIMMLKCHCRDCQQVSGGGFVPAVLVPAESFRLTRGQLVTISRPASDEASINAVIVPNAGRDLQEPNLKRVIRHSSESLLAVLMIQVGFDPRWIFSFQTRNRGTKWIPQL